MSESTQENTNKGRKCATNFKKRNKPQFEEIHNLQFVNDKSAKGKRKLYQYTAPGAKFFLPEKRARKTRTGPWRLLGGNISDPLNLNSLKNSSQEDDNDSVREKPEENKVELIIPPNIHDPLHLLNPVDTQEYVKQLSCLTKRPRKRNKSGCGDYHNEYHVKTRKQSFSRTTSTPVKNNAEGGDSEGDENSASDESPEKKKNFEKLNLKKDQHHVEKIVSPVTPQPWKKMPTKNNNRTTNANKTTETGVDESVEKSDVVELENKDEETTKEEEQEVEKKPEIPSKKEVDEKRQQEENLEIQEQRKAKKLRAQQRNVKYQYGNYNPYYGYETLNEDIDVRLKVFQKHAHLFKNKDVLDIGCNVGMMSIAVAKSQILEPKSVTGIDIDKKLIGIAKAKLKRYVKVPEQTSYSPKDDEESQTLDFKLNRGVEIFPSSFVMTYGNLGQLFKQKQKKNIHSPSKPSTPHTYDARGDAFPENVSFEDMDYVPKDETSLSKDVEQYDLILCLSMTKWIHLNYGDNGIKLTFKRLFNQLRPGGKLILEAHNWSSYKKKKKNTDKFYENFKAIEFSPAKFSEYLLSPEVGFSHSYILGAPQHLSKGFRRPILLYVKGDFTPNQAAKWSDAYIPSTPHEYSRPPIYLDLLYNNRHGSTVTSPFNYRPRSTPYYMASPYLTSPSPYYNPRQSDSYLPSYDNDFPRNNVFMSPGYYLSSPSSRRTSERTCNEESNEVQRSPSTNRSHIYMPSTFVPPSTTTSQYASTSAANKNTDNTNNP